MDFLDYFQSLEKDLKSSNDKNEFGESENVSDELKYKSPQEVEYRGDFKPELSQLLYDFQLSDGISDGNFDDLNLNENDLEEMIKNFLKI